MNPQAPIGVFDSGVGGLSVLRALRAALPGEDFVYLADNAHAPYGERGDAFVAARSRHIAHQLRVQHGIKALVVACNTATAAAIELLRAEHPGLPMVGVEPALKPAAALTRTGRVGVLATRGTLGSARFRALQASLAARAEFVLQPCDGLAEAIEQADAIKTRALCARYTRTAGLFGTETGCIDTLVLGCTHYPFAQDELRALLGPEVRLIETGEPVARHTHHVLATAGLLKPAGRHRGQVTLLASGDSAPLAAAAQRWLGI
ncbi:MAG: glutamate racemase [Ramlibacter sp.]|nr:glutamate racemase [Ramlibacter sp.]